jgi:37-kD nucleoid-associated bacterial protein.
MRVETFTVDQVIIHELTKRETAPPAPPGLIMSEVPSALDADLRGYFARRIVDASRSGSFPVVVDGSLGSPVPDLVFTQLTDPDADFVAISRDIVQHLFDSQRRVSSSPGLLVVVAGTVDTGPCAALLKLQKQEGVRLERIGAAGQQTFSVEHLRQLMLTNETRVFKVAMFPAEDLATAVDIHGVVSDKQRPYAPEKQVADFFLRDFLGCQVRDNPAKATSGFFHVSEKFINDEVAEPQARTQYHRALLSELTSQATMVDPRQFAALHLSPEDAPRFVDYLRDHDVGTGQFDKSIELIKNRLREIEYVLGSGLKVRGPEEAWDDHVEVSQTDGNMLELLIEDRLDSVNGR